MQEILDRFQHDSDMQTLLEGLRSGMKEQMVAGLAGSARQVLMASMHQTLDRPLLIVTHNMFAAQKLAEDLQECLSSDQVKVYPANELTFAEAALTSPELLSQRLETMFACAEGFRGILVTPYAGIRKFLPTLAEWKQSFIRVKTGAALDLHETLKRMERMGYERVERVENPGEMCVRGGILDCFPRIGDTAYRIELFDDEVDSIRTFEVSDQRSIDNVTELTISPCREIVADDRRLRAAADHAHDLMQQRLGQLTDPKTKQLLQSRLSEEIEQLREGVHFPEIYKYIGLIYPERETLADYLPDDTVLVLDEPVRLRETAKQMEQDEGEAVTSLLKEGKALPAMKWARAYDEQFHTLPFPVIYISLFLRQIPNTSPQNIINFVTRPMQNFHGQMNLLKSELERWKKTGMHVMMMADGKERSERMRRILQDYRIPEPLMIQANLLSGFEFPAIKLIVITEGELFGGKQRKVRKTRKTLDNAERIKSYQELKVGDYVVHVNHGIGKYTGIGTLEVGGIHKDYMHIQYAGGDKLSVPIDQIELVQKYTGADEKEPKLYKLGGTEWTRVKNKARSSVKDIADDLVKLYAERQAAPGYAFSKDAPYQKEFESLFPYEETPDQLRAIDEIKRDMEKPHPMDRLLCGDVGYGKTEVALRAAFKAVMEGKQVAVLVPTTILAQQHYETFRERFSDFPVRLEVLSRFRSKKQQAETIKGLKTGVVDLVIGTHRMLSKDVQFKDLGLLVVDEEQRFGVTHKEKIKQLRTNVDVLTLTATPIPRTLHMSMLGVRDLSVIETPPENRFPVQTYVCEYSSTLVREAIEREMARGGQVFYLFNRVQGIYRISEQISALVPDARIAVSHGKMSEQELERTILDFLDGEYDVLVSTTIIETGVDIPNVNTLIIHDSDKMGLAQLYQLRGRVGRSNRVAYAYLTYQQDKVLNEVAEKRLQAIKEFTELGSGFKIAMRDLAIRGAGNLLGAEQHGFIASVGFDLYTQMLSEEIEQRKTEIGVAGKAEEPAWSTRLDMEVDAYLPSEYIADSMLKIEIYKKTASVRTLDEADELRDELIDRFGDLPQAVENLLRVARLKAYGARYKIVRMAMHKGDLDIELDDRGERQIEPQRIIRLGAEFDNRIKLNPGRQMKITIRSKDLGTEEALVVLERFLSKFEEVSSKGEELQNAVH